MTLHPKRLALLITAAAHRPSGEEWRSDRLERAIGEWVQAGAPDVEWEINRGRLLADVLGGEE